MLGILFLLDASRALFGLVGCAAVCPGAFSPLVFCYFLRAVLGVPDVLLRFMRQVVVAVRFVMRAVLGVPGVVLRLVRQVVWAVQ